jgi:RND family efflux transporter MFP subunit
MLRTSVFLLSLFSYLPAAMAETVTLSPTPVTEWKAVYGRIEARDRVPARARIGGTVIALTVDEGDTVRAGQPIATIIDDKLAFQISALAAQKAALLAQLSNAEAERARGEQLLEQGVITVQRLDALRTQVEVLQGQIAANDAQAELVRQSQNEGVVLAPAAGRVLDVPVAKGAVLMPGETVATISAGGTFLRLAVPERHAVMLQEGALIQIEDPSGLREGRLVRVYPLVENGRVIADVDVAGASDRFIDARVLVRLPMGERMALLVPASALMTRSGLDFVEVETETGPVLRAVVPGQRLMTEAGEQVEMLSGLRAGDRVVTVPQDALGIGAGHE